LPINPAADQLPPLPPRTLQETASLFGLLSSTVRVHLLWLLAANGQDVSTLAEATGQTVATVSHHLGKLKLARIVEARRQGKHQVYVITDPHALDIVRLGIQPHLQAAHQTSRRKTRHA
jgi:DNA-binding transcriptional ArsR family regulator